MILDLFARRRAYTLVRCSPEGANNVTRSCEAKSLALSLMHHLASIHHRRTTRVVALALSHHMGINPS